MLLLEIRPQNFSRLQVTIGRIIVDDVVLKFWSPLLQQFFPHSIRLNGNENVDVDVEEIYTIETLGDLQFALNQYNIRKRRAYLQGSGRLRNVGNDIDEKVLSYVGKNRHYNVNKRQ